MPAKPRWYSELDRILAELRALPRPWIDRVTVESLLQVGPRRAQQIMAPCVTNTIGASGLADRDRLIEYLAELAQGDGAFYEQRRRRKVGDAIEKLHRQAVERPRLLVEAPHTVVNQAIERLPDGIRLEPGRITVEFITPAQALEKLLALAMAVANDPEDFERLIQVSG
jgi:hypothetical protein